MCSKNIEYKMNNIEVLPDRLTTELGDGRFALVFVKTN